MHLLDQAAMSFVADKTNADLISSGDWIAGEKTIVIFVSRKSSVTQKVLARIIP